MRVVRYTFLLSLLLGSLIAAGPAFAQWSTDPALDNAVCTAAYDQMNPQIASDDSGGAILTWFDDRNGTDNDIYAQRIRADGSVAWKVDGVGVCTEAGNQSYPVIVSDGSGGAIIAWADARNGIDDDIYAQRIDAAGNLLWTAGGVPVDTTNGEQLFPQIVSDGSGGAIITWDDARSGNEDVYAQRMSSTGTAMWAVNGIPIVTAGSNQLSPMITGDGSGGAIITWSDLRNGSNLDIFAQRVNGSGVVQWITNGAAVCMATGDQMNPTIAPDGSGGAIITWTDDRGGSSSDIYAQRINAAGVPQWAADGVIVSNAAGVQQVPVIIGDGSGGAVIAWYDNRSGIDNDIYAERVDASGTSVWSANGVPICTATGAQVFPALAPDGSGGAIISWYDFRNGSDNDVYAQKVNSAGSVQWTTNGMAIATAQNSQQANVILGDGSGGGMIAWEDMRNGVAYDIYAMRIDASGHPFGEDPSITLAGDVANDQGGKMRILWKPSTLDVVPDTTIHSYTVRMGVKSTGLLGKAAPAVMGSSQGNVPEATIYWQTVATVPANWSQGYNALVSTSADSGPQGIPWYYFQVVANSADPLSNWESGVDSGYSVDNLPPPPPVALTARAGVDTVVLAWTPVSAPDLWGYDVYRSTSPITSGSLAAATPLASTPIPFYADVHPVAGVPSYYVVAARDIHGNLSAPSNEASTTLTGVESQGSVPKAYALMQNYPNPFNPTTAIRYQLSEVSRVTLKVYDMLGRDVATLVEGEQAAGSYSVTFDGSRLSSGVYLYRIEAAGKDGRDFTAVKRLLLMK